MNVKRLKVKEAETQPALGVLVLECPPSRSRRLEVEMAEVRQAFRVAIASVLESSMPFPLQAFKDRWDETTLIPTYYESPWPFVVRAEARERSFEILEYADGRPIIALGDEFAAAQYPKVPDNVLVLPRLTSKAWQSRKMVDQMREETQQFLLPWIINNDSP